MAELINLSTNKVLDKFGLPFIKVIADSDMHAYSFKVLFYYIKSGNRFW